MFILNNIHDREYIKLYRSRGSAEPIFDISQKQISLPKSGDWCDLKVGDLVSVVKSSRKLSRICQVASIGQANDEDVVHPDAADQHLIWGEPVARFKANILSDYSRILERHGVQHPHLRSYKFTVGFNIANLEGQLDLAEVENKLCKTVGELRSSFRK